jgi:hypothetical protein
MILNISQSSLKIILPLTSLPLPPFPSLQLHLPPQLLQLPQYPLKSRPVCLIFILLLHTSFAAGIYLDQKDINLAVGTQQVITGVLTIGLFVCMVLELLAPEVLFLIALIVLMLCQILSLSETLSGSTSFHPIIS